MTTLIWEGDLFHDVNLISPAKFWMGASIPLDMFSDFWEIVVEPDEELKKKTKKRDAMKQQGILKVISGDKEYFYEDEGHGRTLDLYPRIGRYYIEPYDEEIDILDFSILHGYLLGHCHFKLEIDGEFEREKLTFDPKTSTVLYDGKEFEVMPYCLEQEKWESITGSETLNSYTGRSGSGYFHDGRYFNAWKKNKNGEVKQVNMKDYCAFLDKDENELVPNYGFDKTIQPNAKKYQTLFRKDTVKRRIVTDSIWNYSTRDLDHDVIISDPSLDSFQGTRKRL